MLPYCLNCILFTMLLELKLTYLSYFFSEIIGEHFLGCLFMLF